jgi:hypothetical protein
MPRRDGTGPLGQGSMTGRGFRNMLRTTGFISGQGTLSQDQELSSLKEQAQTLESNLKGIQERITELEKK